MGVAGHTRGRIPLYAFLLGNGLSLIGNMFALVALPWFVIETTGSAAQTGLVGMMSALPALLMGLFGGFAVDRFGGRVMSVISDIVSGVSVLLIPLLHHTFGLNFATLLFLVFLGALLDVPGVTARRTMLPELAEDADLRAETVNAAFENMQGGALVIGPVLAGACIGLIGTVNLLWITAAGFAISAVLIGVFAPDVRHVEESAPESGPRATLTAMLAGFRYLQADALLLGIAISLTLMNFMNGPYWAVVLPVQIEAEFGNASRFGLLLTLLGVGNLVGGTLYGAIGHRFRHLRWQIYLLGISTFPAYAWLWYTGAPYAVLAVGGLLMGVISGPINPLMVTVRMERIPAHLRGRVFATFSGLAGAATPLGMVFNGWLIDTAGASRGILIISTFATVVVTILWLLPGLHAMNEDTPASVRQRRLAPDPTE